MAFADHIIRSLHDPRLYREVARRSPLRSLLHVGRIALIAALATTIAATLWLSSLWQDHVAPVLDALPTITIRAGEATVEGPQPWVRRVVRDAAGHDWLIVLHTSGRTTGFAPGERGVLLLRTEIQVKSTETRVDSVPLSRVGDLRLGPKALRRAVLWRLMLVPPALLGVMLIWFFLVKALQALVLTWWLRGVSARRREVALPFRARLAVATHALTAPVLLEALAWWLPLPGLLAWPLYFVLALLYAAAGERQVEPTT